MAGCCMLPIFLLDGRVRRPDVRGREMHNRLIHVSTECLRSRAKCTVRLPLTSAGFGSISPKATIGRFSGQRRQSESRCRDGHRWQDVLAVEYLRIHDEGGRFDDVNEALVLVLFSDDWAAPKGIVEDMNRLVVMLRPIAVFRASRR